MLNCRNTPYTHPEDRFKNKNLSDFLAKYDKFRLVLSAGDTTQGNLPETLRRGWEGVQMKGNQVTTQGNLPETLRRGWEGGTVRSFLKRLAPESSVQLPG